MDVAICPESIDVLVRLVPARCTNHMQCTFQCRYTIYVCQFVHASDFESKCFWANSHNPNHRIAFAIHVILNMLNAYYNQFHVGMEIASSNVDG